MLPQLITLGIAILLAGYRVFVFRKSRKSAVSALGFSLEPRSFVDFGAGAAIGAIAISLIFLSEWSAGLLHVDKINPISGLADGNFVFVAKPLLEEFVFRSAILGGLLLLIPRRWIAVTLSAVFFGAVHVTNGNAGVISIFSTMLGGLAYGYAFAAFEKIWFPFGLHMTWNYFQARVFGFVLSGGLNGGMPYLQQHDTGPPLLTGGRYGPEGGLIGLGARVVVLCLIGVGLTLERRMCGKEINAGAVE